MKNIVIDTSALIAVIANEPEKRRLASLEVEGVALGVSTAEIVDIVRESRTRYDNVS